MTRLWEESESRANCYVECANYIDQRLGWGSGLKAAVPSFILPIFLVALYFKDLIFRVPAYKNMYYYVQHLHCTCLTLGHNMVQSK